MVGPEVSNFNLLNWFKKTLEIKYSEEEAFMEGNDLTTSQVATDLNRLFRANGVTKSFENEMLRYLNTIIPLAK